MYMNYTVKILLVDDSSSQQLTESQISDMLQSAIADSGCNFEIEELELLDVE